MDYGDVLTKQEIGKLYKFSIAYKSDINFIKYFESFDERETVDKIVKILKKKTKSLLKTDLESSKLYSIDSWINDRDKILDVIWFLDDELVNRYSFVKKFIKKNEQYSRNSLQFFKTLNSIINSINLLEMRGRDSLGLCFQFVLKQNKANLEWYKTSEIEKQYLSEIVDNKIVIHAIYRTFNRIGSLGENSEIILNEFRCDKTIINLINSGSFESISIIAHTRWASVGSVNQQNIHPLVNLKRSTNKIPTILSFVNGDIYNYREIYQKMVWHDKVNYNINEEIDSIALSYLFSEKNTFSTVKQIREKLSTIVGSITGNLLSTENPSKVLIFKKGSQGMFLGKNTDRFYFASDAYGLIEDCNKVYNLDNNCFGLFDAEENLSDFKIYGIDSSLEKKIKNKDYIKVTISSRDVSKKNIIKTLNMYRGIGTLLIPFG